MYPPDIVKEPEPQAVHYASLLHNIFADKHFNQHIANRRRRSFVVYQKGIV
jgi:hypothetical protein